MLKQVIAIVLLSILAILFMPYAQQGLHAIINAESWVATILKKVFSNDGAGDLVRQVLTLLVIPLAIGTVPALLYWLARKHWFPYFMELVWITWLLQTAALIVLYKVAAT